MEFASVTLLMTLVMTLLLRRKTGPELVREAGFDVHDAA
jgi:hypothetical protein